jgi:TM2 domain-containing membrane protein YozV
MPPVRRPQSGRPVVVANIMPVTTAQVGAMTPANSDKACPYCGEQILAVAMKCKHCGEFLDPALRAAKATPQVATSPQATGAQQPTAIHISNINTNIVGVGQTAKRWSPVVAFLLSVLIPGLGQLYKGHLLRGILWFIIVLIGYAFIFPGLILHLVCAIEAASGDPYR